MKRCTRCNHPAVDAVGSPQCSMFDPPDVDPRATDAARAEIRAGRVLCSACQRTGDLFTGPDRYRVALEVEGWFKGPMSKVWLCSMSTGPFDNRQAAIEHAEEEMRYRTRTTNDNTGLAVRIVNRGRYFDPPVVEWQGMIGGWHRVDDGSTCIQDSEPEGCTGEDHVDTARKGVCQGCGAELTELTILGHTCPGGFPVVAPVVVTAPPHHFPQPVIDHWTRKVEEAERAQAVADLDDEDEDDCAHCCGCADYQGCDTGKAATAAKEG